MHQQARGCLRIHSSPCVSRPNARLRHPSIVVDDTPLRQWQPHATHSPPCTCAVHVPLSAHHQQQASGLGDAGGHRHGLVVQRLETGRQSCREGWRCELAYEKEATAMAWSYSGLKPADRPAVHAIQRPVLAVMCPGRRAGNAECTARQPAPRPSGLSRQATCRSSCAQNHLCSKPTALITHPCRCCSCRPGCRSGRRPAHPHR